MSTIAKVKSYVNKYFEEHDIGIPGPGPGKENILVDEAYQTIMEIYNSSELHKIPNNDQVLKDTILNDTLRKLNGYLLLNRKIDRYAVLLEFMRERDEYKFSYYIKESRLRDYLDKYHSDKEGTAFVDVEDILKKVGKEKKLRYRN